MSNYDFYFNDYGRGDDLVLIDCDSNISKPLKFERKQQYTIKVNERYCVKMYYSQNSDNAIHIDTYDSEQGNSLKLILCTEIDRDKELFCSYQGIRINSEELVTLLKNYIILGTIASVNFSCNDTRNYLKIDRDTVTEKAKSEFLKIFKELLYYAFEGIAKILIKIAKSDEDIKEYCNYIKEIEPCVKEFAGILQEYCNIQSKGDQLYNEKIEYENKGRQLFKSLFTENKIDQYKFEVFIKQLGRFILSNNVYLYNDFSNGIGLANALVVDDNLSEQKIRYNLLDLFDSFADISGGKSWGSKNLFGRVSLNGQYHRMKFLKFPVGAMYTYHTVLGQTEFLKDTNYSNILTAYGDYYFDSYEYCYSENDYDITSPDVWYYEDKGKLIDIKFGTDLLRRNNIYFDMNYLFGIQLKDENIVIPPYQINKLNIVNNKILLECSYNNEKNTIKCNEKTIYTYFYKDIVKFDYDGESFESKGYIIMSDLDYFCMPALKKYELLAINKKNLMFNYKVYLEKSKYKDFEQELYLILPMDKDLAERLLDYYFEKYDEIVDKINNNNSLDDIFNGLWNDINKEYINEKINDYLERIYLMDNSKIKDECKIPAIKLMKNISYYIFNYRFNKNAVNCKMD